jgi:hypothetical protein
MTVIDEIAAERRRQIEVEGWTPEHDDKHADGGLAKAAGCYALVAGFPSASRSLWTGRNRDGEQTPWSNWPWDPKWWKPKSRRRDLIRAAALIVAEIERLDRTGQPQIADTKTCETCANFPYPDRFCRDTPSELCTGWSATPDPLCVGGKGGQS